MDIIGLGGGLHDFAACLLQNNGKIIAIEDERITRIRYSFRANTQHIESVNYCLKYSNSKNNEHRIIADHLIEGKAFEKIERLNHHLAHAYSVFHTSPFDKAAILVADGVGSVLDESTQLRETTSYAIGEGNNIRFLGKITGTRSDEKASPDNPRIWNNSLGDLYRAVTEIIGFGFLQAGKTMGLMPYGDDRYVTTIMQFVDLLPNGMFEVKVSGENGLVRTLKRIRDEQIQKHDSFQVNASLAYAGQYGLEEILKHCLAHLWEITKTQNLCFVGGVALNSVFNGQIIKLSNFKNVHVLFAPGDNGAAIGSAIWGKLSKEQPLESVRFHPSPYLGHEYSKSEIENIIRKNNLHYQTPTDLYGMVARFLKAENIVAWYQGASEFGPRALGNRSILANPTPKEMKDRLNKIKGREWFRPVAPAVLAENLNTYFSSDTLSPYMQFVSSVKDNYREVLKGCTHVDGTARVQSVAKDENPKFYRLLEEYGNLTGHPILINTSFNIKSEPIVETPSDAIDTFIKSELDVLVLDEFVISKH